MLETSEKIQSREITVPSSATNAVARFFERAQSLKEHTAVRFKENKGLYKDMSWADFAKLATSIASGLASLGLKKGDSVAIFSQTSHVWVAADIAIMSNGAFSVPIYPNSSKADIQFILENSDSKIVFVQNEQTIEKVLALREELTKVKHIVMLNSPKDGVSYADFVAQKNIDKELLDRNYFLFLAQLVEIGEEKLPNNIQSIEKNLSIEPDSPATIIYTSGTTGTPKGVLLTHSNLKAVVDAMHDAIPITESDTYLSYLPLSHVFERIAGEFYWMHWGGICAFAENIESMAKNMAEIEPSMLLVVPRVLDRIYTKVMNGIEGASPRARKLIDWSLRIGREMLECRAQGEKPRRLLEAKHWLANRLVLEKLHEKIGRNLRLIVSGGAPATREVIEFFNVIGIGTIEGYGLTETAAPATVNLPERVKPGTVGPPLPRVELKLGEDNEILLKGPTVFKGYYKDEEANKASFEDGWFKTGDIGTLDADNYLTITDRKKDLIINSAGKNIAPQRIEAILRTVPLITQAVVFGDKQPNLVALLTLDEDKAKELAEEKNWSFKEFSDLASSSELQQYIRQEINARSGALAEYERIRKFNILPEDLSVEKGELTATMKIKRNVIAKEYKTIIDQLYRSKDDSASTQKNSSAPSETSDLAGSSSSSKR